MTSFNGNIFRVTGHLCGKFTGHRWITRTKGSDADLNVFFDLRLNKRLSKHSWDCWFGRPSCLLWRQSNGILSRPIHSQHQDSVQDSFHAKSVDTMPVFNSEVSLYLNTNVNGWSYTGAGFKEIWMIPNNAEYLWTSLFDSRNATS